MCGVCVWEASLFIYLGGCSVGYCRRKYWLDMQNLLHIDNEIMPGWGEINGVQSMV